ncbi:hypothetical protein [Stenotrophomonas sp.]|uniref:hypothetical protein n=1 Tax=Stenotrophomonas sp. TaxID=69392 RepID=UPI0028B20E72|nr:hypothetical protein [Stenotrophomonas sp.]
MKIEAGMAATLHTARQALSGNDATTQTPFSQLLAQSQAQTAAAPPRTVGSVREIDLAGLLTARDKAILGWPGNTDDLTSVAAGILALDREAGVVRGDVSREYLFGDPAKGVVGLIGSMHPETLSKNKDVAAAIAARFELYR